MYTTAKEAIKNNQKYYFTGKPCKHGHIANRLANTRYCVECCKNVASKWQKDNRERAREISKKCYYKYHERYLAIASKYRSENKEKIKAAGIKYRTTNKEQYAVLNRCNVATRTASKILRTPKWLTSEDIWVIKEIYRLARLRTQMFGVAWEVDHIVPLQGKIVSGLHEPGNLQVIPATKNRSKGNTFRN